MKIGQMVYTVNGDTNKVDKWIFNGKLRAEDETLVHLVRGKKYCYLPERCVFTSESEALKIAEQHK